MDKGGFVHSLTLFLVVEQRMTKQQNLEDRGNVRKTMRSEDSWHFLY